MSKTKTLTPLEAVEPDSQQQQWSGRAGAARRRRARRLSGRRLSGAARGWLEPDWIIGTSIGAINAGIIAGNRPRIGLPRLEEFWHRVESNDSGAPFLPGPG